MQSVKPGRGLEDREAICKNGRMLKKVEGCLKKWEAIFTTGRMFKQLEGNL